MKIAINNQVGPDDYLIPSEIIDNLGLIVEIMKTNKNEVIGGAATQTVAQNNFEFVKSIMTTQKKDTDDIIVSELELKELIRILNAVDTHSSDAEEFYESSEILEGALKFMLILLEIGKGKDDTIQLISYQELQEELYSNRNI